jgi:hypothetical protein
LDRSPSVKSVSMLTFKLFFFWILKSEKVNFIHFVLKNLKKAFKNVEFIHSALKILKEIFKMCEIFDRFPSLMMSLFTISDIRIKTCIICCFFCY